MGSQISHTLEIQISNHTQNFTLEKPRTHFLFGQSCVPPSPELPPGSSDSCRFSSFSNSLTIEGLLTYEAESFTLAIFFCVPSELEHGRLKLGLELSLDKVHQGSLLESFAHMVEGRRSLVSARSSRTICEIHQDHQEPAQVSAGPVKVMATMSHSRSAVIRVVVRERGDSVGEKHVQEK